MFLYMGSLLSCELEDPIVYSKKFHKGMIHFAKKEYDDSFKTLITFVDERVLLEKELIGAISKIRAMIEESCLSNNTIDWLINISTSRVNYTIVEAALSRMYFHGYCIKRNFRKTIEIERRGVELNIPNCQENLKNALNSSAYTIEEYQRLEDRHQKLRLRYIIKDRFYSEEVTDIIQSYTYQY
jgi:intein/homing endonuclease